MWTNSQETADLLIFTEELLNIKLHFLFSECYEGYEGFLEILRGYHSMTLHKRWSFY